MDENVENLKTEVDTKFKSLDGKLNYLLFALKNKRVKWQNTMQ